MTDIDREIDDLIERERAGRASASDRFPNCTCYAPDDAEPEDHDEDCPENPGTEE